MFGLACASQHAAMMQCVQLCCRLHVLLASHCNQKQAYAYGTRSHLLLFVCSKTTTCCRCIFLLLQAGGPLLSSYTNLTLGVRLGLLSPDSQHILLLHARHSSSGSNATRVRQPVYAGGGLGCALVCCCGSSHSLQSTGMVVCAAVCREPRMVQVDLGTLCMMSWQVKVCAPWLYVICLG